jgi:DNA (cytosine-5)-methyltransferase 1
MISASATASTARPLRAGNFAAVHLHENARPKSIPLVADLCCGMGGLSLAAQQLGMQVVAGVDLNASALRTFKRNFPKASALQGSVRSPAILGQCSALLKPLNGSSPASVIVSGPPCQGFSVAGPRNPADPRNQILVAVARAIVELAPRCALIENVSTVLAKDHAERLRKFERTLSDGGYYVQKTLLNAVDFGVAQRRKRVFFLISDRRLQEKEIIERLEALKQSPLSSKTALTGLPTPPNRPADYDDELDYGGIPNHFSMCHSARVMDKIATIEPGTGPMSYRRLHPSRPANTLFSGHRAPPAHFSEPRSITTREAARLQGFPDNFRIFGSFGNQMEQVTNAVPPPLAKAVLRTLAELVGLSLQSHA